MIWMRRGYLSPSRFCWHRFNRLELRFISCFAPGLSPPAIKLYGWDDVGRQLKGIYERALNTS